MGIVEAIIGGVTAVSTVFRSIAGIFRRREQRKALQKQVGRNRWRRR